MWNSSRFGSDWIESEKYNGSKYRAWERWRILTLGVLKRNLRSYTHRQLFKFTTSKFTNLLNTWLKWFSVISSSRLLVHLIDLTYFAFFCSKFSNLLGTTFSEKMTSFHSCGLSIAARNVLLSLLRINRDIMSHFDMSCTAAECGRSWIDGDWKYM